VCKLYSRRVGLGVPRGFPGRKEVYTFQAFLNKRNKCLLLQNSRKITFLCYGKKYVVIGWWIKQEVLGRTNRLLSLTRHGPHWKRRVQQFFYCGVCIRYRGNVSTEPLPRNDRGNFTEPLTSNDKGIFTEPLPSNDKGIFTEQLPRNDRGKCRQTHIHTHR
jgi:hypothetical protein